MKTNKMNRLRAGAALQAFALVGASFYATSALAQDAAVAQDAPVATQEDPGIIVTGSLFRRANAETASPVTIISSETLERAGTTTISDALRQVSADGAGSIPTGFTGGFSAGGSAVSLRGLGVSSTLVLIDGLRSAAFPLNDDGHNTYTDLNSIPFSMVERVEVLKDGASSTYGADAIGGVVNIILKKQFTGVAGNVEAGVAEGGYGSRYRANLTAGIGDYQASGWNFYVNGEYQRDGRISVQDVGFPFNTRDLSSINGLFNQNSAGNSLTAATPFAYVRRTNQTNLNDPFSGGTVATGQYTALNLANCGSGTFTVTGAAGGVGCRQDLIQQYSQVQPQQTRYSVNGRLSIRVSDTIEAYVLGSYSNSGVSIVGAPMAIRQRQPYGASPANASNNPGVVLPYFVCAAGVNCVTAADRRLNPNNPYATNASADAATAAANAARIYYMFGDIYSGSDRTNEVFRGAVGFNGSLGSKTNWRVEAVAARDNLSLTSYGMLNIEGLRNVINTGAYNFVDPSLNSAAVRATVAPTITARSHTTMLSLDGSITHRVMDLAGGPLQVALGGQVRRETLDNPGSNPNRVNYANTAAAFGSRTVTAGYFEIDAPVTRELELNASGRFDHYSEGFSKLSPKVGAKYSPVRQVSIRGTYSEGFRAPSFAESNPRSSFPGFVTYSLPESFQLAHGGLISGGNTNPYVQAYSIGGGYSGNPNLKPETSRSFTAGIVVEPVRGLTFTVDYYNVKKKNVIVAGPNAGDARAAYYAGRPLPAGYTVGAVDAVDPLFPDALPRVLIINGPYVNAGYFKTQGLDMSANLNIGITDGVRLISRVDVTKLLNFNVDPGTGIIQKYKGTMGPYDLSSGAGTPEWRGNWQNTLDFGDFSLTATTYYTSRLKAVAADNNPTDLSCAANLYGSGETACFVKRFIYADLNARYRVNDDFSFYVNVGNVTNARAPLAPASYSGVNYLPTWHYAGVVGRTYRAGASFKF